MEIEEIVFQGHKRTWANNWETEGYIEVRLDRFFGTLPWLVDHASAVVYHVKWKSSDHSLLILDTNPVHGKRKARFYFDKGWVNKPGIEEVVRHAWETECEGSPMFQVASKIKLYRLGLLNWNRQKRHNAAVRIQEIQEAMEQMKDQGENRNWDTCMI